MAGKDDSEPSPDKGSGRHPWSFGEKILLTLVACLGAFYFFRLPDASLAHLLWAVVFVALIGLWGSGSRQEKEEPALRKQGEPKTRPSKLMLVGQAVLLFMTVVAVISSLYVFYVLETLEPFLRPFRQGHCNAGGGAFVSLIPALSFLIWKRNRP